jgi:hypothetical protein
MIMNTTKILLCGLFCFALTLSYSQEVKTASENIPGLDRTPTRIQTSITPGFKKIGTLVPKSINEISTSIWSLGCETLDRNLASWENYRNYIRPLGIKHIRLQGGWARTEKEKGVYNFAWLDSIVDDAHALGLQICLETSYGNRLYEKDAALGPGGKLPSGDETLKAWDAWVQAMAKRYSAKGVKDWMMYNEPNLNKENKVEEMAAFNIRTAEIIKRVAPEARIGGLVLSNTDLKMVESFLKLLKEEGKEKLFYWLIYHAYGANPDEIYPSVEKMQELSQKYAPHLKLWQGEAGCASEEVQYALSGIDWTELSHAKWNARRMIGDIGHGVKSSVFTISDLSYHKDFISRYGLLKTNPDNSIVKVKTAYYVVQNVVSVLNDVVDLADNYDVNIVSEKNLSLYKFRDKETGFPVIVFWDGTAVPSNSCNIQKASFVLKNANFKEPVWIDLITGNIYEIASEQILSEGSASIFHGIPVYDGPSLITDKSLLKYTPAKNRK